MRKWLVMVVMAGALLCDWTTPVTRAENASDAGTVTVEVRGLRSGLGRVIIALYGSDDGFPSRFEKALKKVTVEIRDGRASARFEGIAPGRYAVCAVHDENGNGRTDTNFIGIPREGVGVSNNVRSRIGPPDFDDAVFVHGAGPTVLEILLRYL